MAITFSIAPNPHWVIIDNFSKLPNGAAIYTYSSLNPSQFKPAFQDAGGTIPYGQPITGFGNGTMPPIFWSFDSDNPDDTYYIRVYDSADPTVQNFLWDFDGISGSSGGGGGTVTTNNSIKNLISNGQFYRNAGTISPVSTFQVLAPSNNAGYVGNLADSSGPAAPDIIFAKNNTTSTDAISFPLFTPIGLSDLAPNPTPIQYFKYACTGAGSGETYKYLQLPIVQGLQNLSGATISIKIYARLNSGDDNVTLTLRQFFGNGGGSPDVITPISGIADLDTTWQSFIFNSIVVPSIAGKTLGSCGNDGLFLQINMPLSPALINFDCVLAAVYVSPSVSNVDFNTNDQTDSIISLPRTGDIRISLNSFFPFGWVTMNDGTIGSAASNATTRANLDTFPLFDLIWRTFQSSQTLAPMLTSASAPVAYGASSFADFAANNQLTLTVQAGRVIAGVSGSHLIGTSGGSDTHVLTQGELPTTVGVVQSSTNISVTPGGTPISGIGGANTANNTISLGSGTAIDIRQPTVYQNIFIKL